MNKASSRTVVQSSSSTASRGTTVVFTATVTAQAPGSGTVRFRIDGVNRGAAVSLNSSGQAAYAIATLSVGRPTVSAGYTGDGSFHGSTSGNITQRIR